MLAIFACALAPVSAACGDASGGGPSGAANDGSVETGLTYHDDIAPILYGNCMPCHAAGGIGEGSANLTAYESVFPRRALIKNAVVERRMPHFGANASGDCQEFKDARWLSDEQIETIADWVDGGAPEGDPKPAPAMPTREPIIEGEPDLTLAMPGSYVSAGEALDDYRCVLVETGLDDDMYLTGYEVEAGEPAVVHHVLLFEVNDDAVADAYRAANGADGKVGFPCAGPVLTAGTNDDVEILFSWLPGALGQRYPEGTGLRITKGHPVVMQIHYNYSAGPMEDLTKVHLDLEPVTGATKEAILYTVDNYNIVLAAQQAETQTISAGWLPQPAEVPVKIWGVYPHMHKLGRSMKVEMNETAPECLLDADRYRFEWQNFYFYKEPITFPALGQLKVTCGYDTSTVNEPVTWGEGTENEMCLVWFYVTL